MPRKKKKKQNPNKQQQQFINWISKTNFKVILHFTFTFKYILVKELNLVKNLPI